MTREEIRERADNIVEALILSTSLSFVTAHVQSKLLSLVRATLEEAARAVCPDCAVALAEQENVADATFFWVHTDRSSAGPWRSKVCPAAPIHDLIAKLDKEGES